MKTMQFFALFLLFPITSFSQPSYDAAIKEGEAAALELINAKQASAIGISLVDSKGVIWSHTFGLVDSATGQAASDTTLFGIGSISKLFAAMAVMKLVEANLINLDTPLVTYLPNFTMLSPDYKKITVRMLLNHSAGLPGTDYRNALTRSRYPGYLNQVLHTLSQSHLKAPPGFMNVYCNDCFTLVEALVKARTGKDYTQFVQEEILTPLGMHNSRYPLQRFADTAFARVYVDGKQRPQEIINLMASGALYSTPTDLAQVAKLLLNKGAPLLSEASVAEMSKDQTIGTFNPVRNDGFTYGLGFDSVIQPGLSAVGFDGWAKGGDTVDYGSMLVVSPKAQLGVVVLGASSFGSEKAKAIAERVLLRALAENQLIPSFPTPLPQPSFIPSTTTPIPEDSTQQYATTDMLLKNEKQNDGSLNTSLLSDSGWKLLTNYHPQPDGWFINTTPPITEIKQIEANLLGNQTPYLISRAPRGYGHYLETSVFSQKLESSSEALSPTWKARLDKTWLVVNAHPDEMEWNGLDPRLRLSEVPGSPSLIAVRPPEDNNRFHVVNPANSDKQASMMLIIPQLNGRDMNDLVGVQRRNGEWLRYGSYMHQPLNSVRTLALNIPSKVTIGSDGFAEWMGIKSQDNKTQLTINTRGKWFLYDANYVLIDKGKGNAAVVIPAGKGSNLLMLYGKPGNTIRLLIKKKAY